MWITTITKPCLWFMYLKPCHTHNYSELFQIIKTKSLQNNTDQTMFIIHQESPIDTNTLTQGWCAKGHFISWGMWVTWNIEQSLYQVLCMWSDLSWLPHSLLPRLFLRPFLPASRIVWSGEGMGTRLWCICHVNVMWLSIQQQQHYSCQPLLFFV